MATNEVYQDANVIPLPVVASVVSGEVVVVGGLVGVAQTDRDADGNATVKLNGAHKLPLAATTTVGQAVYGHATGGGAVTARVQLVDVTATTGTLLGYALEAVTVSSGTKPVTVRLVG